MDNNLNFSYRIVGAYGFFPFGISGSPLEQPLSGLSLDSTVEEVLKGVQKQVNDFRGRPALGIVTANGLTAAVSYDFQDGSLKPPNSSQPSNGNRLVRTQTYVPADGAGGLYTGVIQYYRSITVEAKNPPSKGPNVPFNIRLRSKGQPPVSTTKLVDSLADFASPKDLFNFLADYRVLSWNIVQRTVLIQLKGDAQQRFKAISDQLTERKDDIELLFKSGNTYFDLNKIDDELGAIS